MSSIIRHNFHIISRKILLGDVIIIKNNKYNDDYYYVLARLYIKKYRKLKNYTTQELAEKCELIHQFIRDLECIKLTRRPKVDTLRRIANALDIDIRKLFAPIDKEGNKRDKK